MSKTIKNYVIIPARYESTRLRGKLLIDIGGKSVIQRTWEKCLEIPGIDGVYVATQDHDIWHHCKDLGIEIIVPNPRPYNGTDMVMHAANLIKDGSRKTVVNVQGEWLDFNPDDVGKMIRCISPDSQEVHSLYYYDSMNKDPNRVKVVMGARSPLYEMWRALYFSRESIPHKSKIGCYHVGIYAFSDEFRRRYRTTYVKNCCNLKSEKLEQLHWLQNNVQIWMHKTSYSLGVDTEKDLKEYVKSIRPKSGAIKRFFSDLVYRWKWTN